MKKISMAVLYLFLSAILVAQKAFTIKGKINLLSNATRISLGSTNGLFTAEIKEDGTFILEGEIIVPGLGLIRTDSSGSDVIWLEPGIYNIECKEITMEGLKGYFFRTPKLKGPQDAEIYNQYNQPQYYVSGTLDEMRKKRKDFDMKYLDSLFKSFPESKTLPEILRYSRPYIGDEATETYMLLLNKDQMGGNDYMMLETYFKRKNKIEKEIYIEDFQMKDQNGKTFKFSGVNKKLILLDFWSSDCAPCRRKHPWLVELYKKYADKGFGIISVSLDDNEEEWKKAILNDNMIWVNVSDLKGWNTPLAEKYFIKSLPFAIWVDKNKKIISISDLSVKEIEEYLK